MTSLTDVSPGGYVYGELGDRPVRPVRERTFEVGSAGLLPAGLSESALEQARTSGYAVGWSQGMREAAARMQADLEELRATAEAGRRRDEEARASAMNALRSAADQLERAALPLAQELQDTIMAAGIQIAEALLGRELRASDTSLDAAHRALNLAPAGEPVAIRLAPADYATIAGTSGIDRLTRKIDGRTVTLSADPELHPGDAIATTGASVIDARLSVALDRVRAAVLS
jgi:flagellar assembly protein FliH